MYYALHHSKGTLILTAEDSEQVIEWSKRQLGHQVSFVSSIESDKSPSVNLVERSGTGLKAASAFGCHPFMCLTAELDQGLEVQFEKKQEFSSSRIERRNFVREPIWH